ncbi:3',5'-cyclic adenosine monophosphate phosphodiesterase CpdA [Planctomycetes bacterium CA13]|uniref:3',5'-cyclic adenosine monophosphate phosphodiesterase CpdA n=1 Tax=Novipirellula herctigrandis TaxID=2527986 RepID=A0A5C5Z560_9BACT|nr:3',5'-cyclic adenosine monophosphate phosphodiesterase CpdA [Planctomycetes bacterium CA13]
MPLHIAPQNRRWFMQSAAALSAASLLVNEDVCGAVTPPVNANTFALLSDTHIPSDADTVARGVNMTDHLDSVIDQIAQLPIRPANLFINGDCAYLKGLPADYENLCRCIAPLDDLGIALHITMGNHDNRPVLYDKLTAMRPQSVAVMNKHASVVESEFANWFLLDTLKKVNVVTGEVGELQLQWLAQELDSRRDKPAIVMAHHTPQFSPPEPEKVWNGISDTDALFDLLDSQDHVKAFLYGHSHKWNISERGHFKLVNLPAVAYVFDESQPNGWVSARLDRDGMHLHLHTHDVAHQKANQRVDILWN